MRKITHALLLSALAASMQGCGLDNYEEPQSRLTGRITYRGEPLQLRHGSIRFDLEQDTYELGDKIEVVISQEGTFSALLFPGKYRFVARPGNGPWTDDSPAVEFTIGDGKRFDFQVTPYFLVRQGECSLAGTSLRGSCTVERVASGRAIEALTLFVGKTRFVDDRGGRSLRSAAFPQPVEGPNSVSLTLDETLARYPVLYARIGLKIEGIDERIYSEAIKVK